MTYSSCLTEAGVGYLKVMKTYTLPDLPYDYGSLAPHLSAELLELHHSKHHAAYVKGANEALEKLADAEPAQLPSLERSLAFHLGGHQLHSLFWKSMTPGGGGPPKESSQRRSPSRLDRSTGLRAASPT